ncbi:hypothetical protein [Vibrio owensii]|uniref:hypothetical protein n=1 Tax=Vibrio owensii TaxID=696485 RepID=UPI00391CAE6B
MEITIGNSEELVTLAQDIRFQVFTTEQKIPNELDFRYCVAHPLTRRCNSFVSFIVAQLSLKPFENGLLVVTAAAAFVRPYRTNN